MIPLLSLLLAVVVLVKTSTKAVVVAGEEVVLLVEEVESPPPSKPKPRSPPSGAAETMHKTGRRLTKYILGEEELDSLDLAGSFSPTKFFRRQLRFISKKALTTCEPASHQRNGDVKALSSVCQSTIFVFSAEKYLSGLVKRLSGNRRLDLEATRHQGRSHFLSKASSLRLICQILIMKFFGLPLYDL